MKNLSLLRIGVVAGALLILAAPAAAIPVVWNLSGFNFNDGGTASGSFTYDAATAQFSAWSIQVAGGTTAALPAFTYDSSDSNVGYSANCGPNYGCLGFDTILSTTVVGDTVRSFGMDVFGTLTDAGGNFGTSIALEESCTITIIQSPTSYAMSCPPADMRHTFAGRVVAATNPIPEPASLGLLSIGLFGLVLSRRNKK